MCDGVVHAVGSDAAPLLSLLYHTRTPRNTPRPCAWSHHQAPPKPPAAQLHAHGPQELEQLVGGDVSRGEPLQGAAHGALELRDLQCVRVCGWALAGSSGREPHKGGQASRCQYQGLWPTATNGSHLLLEARSVLLVLDFQPVKLLQQGAVLQLQRLSSRLQGSLALEQGVCTGSQGLVLSPQAAGGRRQVGILGGQPRVDRCQLRRLRLCEIALLLSGAQVALHILQDGQD